MPTTRGRPRTTTLRNTAIGGPPHTQTGWMVMLLVFSSIFCRTDTKASSYQQYSPPCHTSAWSPPHLFSIDTSRSRPRATRSRYLHTGANHKQLSSGVFEADTSVSSILLIRLPSTLMQFDTWGFRKSRKLIKMWFCRSGICGCDRAPDSLKSRCWKSINE